MRKLWLVVGVVACLGLAGCAQPRVAHEDDPLKEGKTVREISLTQGQTVELEGGLSIGLDSVVIEAIEAAPDDPQAYPGGSGINVHLTLARGAARTELVLSELSPPYQGQREAVWEGFRVRLVGVATPDRAPQVSLTVEAAPRP